jgi:hypothetical protein
VTSPGVGSPLLLAMPCRRQRLFVDRMFVRWGMFEESSRGAPRIVRREFGDLDEIVSRVRCAEILRRSRGPFQAAIVSATLDSVALVWSSHTPPVIARATIPAAYHLFLMRPDSDGAVVVDGHALDERRLVGGEQRSRPAARS